MKREPFTGREHLAIGRRLYSMHDELSEIAIVLQSGYGKTLMRKADRVDRALSQLRSALDSLVCNEHPMSVQAIEGVPITRVYYGWNAQPWFAPTGIGTSEIARNRLRAEAAALVTQRADQ